MNKPKQARTFWLNYFRPSIFLKKYSDLDIYSLKKNGIKMLICDLDNTLSPHFNRFPSKHSIKFVKDVQALGILFVVASNNSKKRVSRYCELLKPDAYVWNAKKPLLNKIKKIMSEYDVLPDELIVLGDQFVTDVWMANRIGSKSILVLPMVDPNKDNESSKLVRILDKFIYQKLQHNNFLQNENTQLENDYVVL